MTIRRQHPWQKRALVVAAAVVGLVFAASLISWLGPRRDALASDPVKPTRRADADPVSTSAKASASFLIGEVLQNSHLHGAASQIGMEELRKCLNGISSHEVSRAIREFLDSKSDAPTTLNFKVDADGLLACAPSLRVFLLDYLGEIDPTGAAIYAKAILLEKDSSEEWAIALRNFAEADASPEGRTFAEQKLQEMWTHEPWVREPSIGFLEAFDVAVHLGGTNLVSPLTTLLRMTNNQAVAHAAYLSLDRLTIQNARETLAMLGHDFDSMEGRESTRANFFARADVREPEQRKLLESYLLNPALKPAEVTKFANLYPNANFMVSHNLLTRSVAPDHAWLAARDAAALRTVRDWIQDSRFERLKPQLEIIRSRLQMFADQTAGRQ